MAPPGYRFGDFRLAPAARELWQDDRLVALPPKSLDCLIYLVEHRERAVGRDELISAVWDHWECWPNHIKELAGSDLYTLRRIAGRDRGLSWGDR